jgi:RNA polymerase sigma factor (sigma-70 family)
MMSDDMALVREFAASRSEPAFAALVKRHVGLVHSAAMRQVGDAHLAEEIAQAVFIILARKAASLGPKTVLSVWLYRTTRYAAADALKINRRRQAREQEAYMQSTLNEPEADTWAQVAPLLDDAMAQLGETDRAALVLRFFENKAVAEVAAALRVSEGAAQRRVLRAVEKLRSWFTRRGVVVPAAVLTVAISANSVQAVPAALAVTISATTVKGAAVATSVTALVNGTIKTILMTTLQKSVIVVALAAAVGAGIYEARKASKLQAEVQVMQQRRAPLADQNQQLTRERDEAKGQLAALRGDIEGFSRNNAELLKLRGEVARLRGQLSQAKSETQSEHDPVSVQAKAWAARVNLLKQRLEQWPETAIPELKYLTEQQWLDAARRDLATDEDYRWSLRELRSSAVSTITYKLASAMERYSQANNGQYTRDLNALRPYVRPPLEDEILQRYEVLPNDGGVEKVEVDGKWLIAVKTPVDNDTARVVVGGGGTALGHFVEFPVEVTRPPRRSPGQ